MAGFQSTKQDRNKLDRKDHIWFQTLNADWKCCLCGAIAAKPPLYPTNAKWFPSKYEELTDAERSMVPYKG